MNTLCLIDGKHVPLYRILWIADLPHFCGSNECQREGEYEVRLEQEESLWANRQERDDALAALREYLGQRPDASQGPGRFGPDDDAS